MARIYLKVAANLLRMGHKQQAMDYLSRALAECNRDLTQQSMRPKTMAALSYTRRV